MASMARSLRRSTPLADVLSDVFGSLASATSKDSMPVAMQTVGTQVDVSSLATAAGTKTEITTTQTESASSPAQKYADAGTQQLLHDLEEALRWPAAESTDRERAKSVSRLNSDAESEICNEEPVTSEAKIIEQEASPSVNVVEAEASSSLVCEGERVLSTVDAGPTSSRCLSKQRSRSQLPNRLSSFSKHRLCGSAPKQANKRHCPKGSSPASSRRRRVCSKPATDKKVALEEQCLDHQDRGIDVHSCNITDVGQSTAIGRKATSYIEDEDGSQDDGWLAKLMRRRAERNAPDPGSKLNATVITTKTVQKEARLSAVEVLQIQLSELALVRAAAEKAGWQAEFNDDVGILEPPPPAPSLVATQIANGVSGSGRTGGNARSRIPAAGTQACLPSSANLTTVLPAIKLPVDVACAAQATDDWHTQHRALLLEATRAYRRSRMDGAEAESQALAILQNLRQRVRDEPGRRALMRSCGVCPKAAVFEKARIGRASEGRIPAQTIANEFEAKTFLPSAQFGDRIEMVKPGYLGEWHELDDVHVEWASQSSGSKDFNACAEVAAGFGTQAAGLFVGRLALSGLTREYPFLIRSGLTHFVCGACERWVTKAEARRHNMRCVGDVAGRAKVFRQSCCEGLGLVLSFKHLPHAGLVELRAEAALDAALRRACWACYWEPTRVRGAWRLTRRANLPVNVFPSLELCGRKEASDKHAATGVSENSDSENDDLEMECSSLQHPDDEPFKTEITIGRGKTQKHIDRANETDGKSPSTGIDRTRQRFRLQDSYNVRPADQPVTFVRPLTNAQLHTLAWMRQREECAKPYASNHILRENLAETDVCMEVRIEREFHDARGGILGDALGYGKTACTIALIAETRQQSLQELLTWPETGKRVLTNATLIVTPPNLFDQWLREVRKFVVSTSGLRILAVGNHTKLKTLTVADFVAADIVLVSFRFFFSEAYQRYFDELTKPGLKVWDDVSVQRRHDFCRKRRQARSKNTAAGEVQGTVGDDPMCAGAQGLKREREAGCAIQRQRRKPAARAMQHAGVKLEPVDSIAVDSVVDAASEISSGVLASATPALQLSKYYLEMRAGKDYLPQRYLDLERRTRRLLREARSTEQLAQSPALFEMFHFKRIVFDEFHEVVQMSSQQAGSTSSTSRMPFYALHALQGRCHWGLTATPFLSSAAAVAHMASLLKVFVPHDDEDEAQRFLDTWVTSNTWDDSGIPLEEHSIEVELLGMERALYLHQRNILSEQGGCGPDSAHAKAAERRLLQLCTHFDPETVSGAAAGDAKAALVQTLQHQRGLHEQAVSRQRVCEIQREEISTRREACERLHAALPESTREATLACGHCEISEVQSLAEAALHASDARLTSELALVEAELRRLAQAALDGNPPAVTAHSDGACEPCRHLGSCEERVKHLNRTKGQAQGDQRQAESRLRFLEAVFQCLEAGEEHCVECPACLNDTDFTTAAILPCGHCLHLACAASAISTQNRCPQCSKPATIQTCTRVSELLQHKQLVPPADDNVGEKSHVSLEALRLQYGSKLCKVVEKVKDIQRIEGDATKCLIFIQWDSISLQLERALKASSISPLVIRGHLSQRQKALARFVDCHEPDASVLLLSLEHSPSGMNFACAHHVLLVHPMYAERREDAVNNELQAIGRVRRRGQNHVVHVHRFVAKATVEETLTKQHQELCCQQRHPKTSS